ncbi:MAG: hypothetical protein D6826_01080 [Alphaproteobacteria bacterium]|nr:MAG: hypothetical protein D6826_01080 [Alphaproteobacteria bacterium]
MTPGPERADHPLLQALRDPRCVLDLDAAGWNDVIWQGRRHAVLARLAVDLERTGLLARVPARARGLLADARAVAALNQTVCRYEARRVARALVPLGIPVVLLKGGAYVVAGLPAARGRLAGDLDILVPPERLGDVERAVHAHGWEAGPIDPYDEHYYRDWTHQIPPLRHRERDTELDIHFTIAPRTSRAHPDTTALFAAARPVADTATGGPLKILAPADMVLHSAVHLFNEDMRLGLRNLFDLHDLLTHFGTTEDGFWETLIERACRHGMERPLFYCLRYCARFCGTTVPAAIQDRVAAFGPRAPVPRLMDALVVRAILPGGAGSGRRATGFARWLLFVRAHWLKMPPGLLLRHLAVKTARRMRAVSTPAPPP